VPHAYFTKNGRFLVLYGNGHDAWSLEAGSVEDMQMLIDQRLVGVGFPTRREPLEALVLALHVSGNQPTNNPPAAGGVADGDAKGIL
jgi:hypothetical protein